MNPSDTPSVVEITGLNRQFGSTLALNQVSLQVRRGRVFGLVGANGAGKTTLIKHVLGRLKAQSGEVRVFGFDPVADPVAVLGRLGYLSENRDLPGWMRVDELLRYTAALKAAGISALVSGVAVLAAMCAMPWLGVFQEVDQFSSALAQHRVIILLGLMILSWRLIAVSLGFTWSGQRWLAKMPVWLMLMYYLGGVTVAMLAADNATWDSFWRLVPGLLVCLVAVKFLLAFLAFRVSLKRGLLAPPALLAYLAVWALLATTLFIPAAILFHDQPGFLPLSLGIVFLTPLARIGFCPIALGWNRHA
jgi:ABC-type transport system involved in cytochrome c biogenesis ATPase subunit